MLKLCRKILPDFSTRGPKDKGQVALILIFIAAIALMLYAVVVNLGRVATQKTLLQISSTTSASFMASALASYSESLYQVQLGGEGKSGDDTSVCAFTGFFAALLKVGIAIMGIVLLPFTGGGSIALAFAIIGLIAAIAGAVIQAAYIQPSISKMWQKLTEDMPDTDNFIESGLRIALQGSVTDGVFVPDIYDFDTDGRFPSNPNASLREDNMNRFAFYYTLRLRRIQGVNVDIARDFQKGLRRILNMIYAPADCNNPSNHQCCYDPANPGKVIPSYCNPCCADGALDPAIYSPQENPLRVGKPVADEFGRRLYLNRPQCCRDDINNPPDIANYPDAKPIPAGYYCGTDLTCGNQGGNTFDSFSTRDAVLGTVLGDPPAAETPYRWVYDRYWEDELRSNDLSIRSRLGRDDESKDYKFRFRGWDNQPNPPPPPAPAVCGNGIREYPEVCDDNNLTANDGCSPTCGLQGPAAPPVVNCRNPGYCTNSGLPAFPQFPGPNFNCCSHWATGVAGLSIIWCNGPHLPVCAEPPPPPVCGDTTAVYPEECDDGNIISGDGCSATCKFEQPAPLAKPPEPIYAPPGWPGPPTPQVDDAAGNTNWTDVYRINDTKTFVFNAVGEPIDRGIFSFLYRISEWGVDLREDNPGTILRDGDFAPGAWPTGEDGKCHNYDARYCKGLGNIAGPNVLCPCPDPYDDDPAIYDTTIDGGNLPLGFPSSLILQDDPDNPGFKYPRQMQLKIDPDSLQYSGKGWIDGLGQGTCDTTACVPDKVPNIKGMVTTNDKCAIDYTQFVDAGVQYYPWKPGADRYCATNWPYNAACAKHGVCRIGEDDDVECNCGEIGLPGVNVITPPAGNDQWPEDALDNFIYGSGEFIDWAKNTVQMTDRQLVSDLKSWYDEAGTWIEPACPPDCSNSFLKRTDAGVLFHWRDMFASYRDNIKKWIDTPVVGAGCDEVWCVPGRPDNATVMINGVAVPIPSSGAPLHSVHGAGSPMAAQMCPGVKTGGDSIGMGSASEGGIVRAGVIFKLGEAWIGNSQTGGPQYGPFYGESADGVSPPIAGNPQGVAQCLTFNGTGNFKGVDYSPLVASFDQYNAAGTVINTYTNLDGNAAKFARCYGQCDQPNCEVLPRSLIPGGDNYDTNSFVVPHTRPLPLAFSDVDLFSGCLSDCNDPTSWNLYCEPSMVRQITPWHGPNKPVVPQYPAYGANPPRPNWPRYLALVRCQTSSGADGCPGQRQLCTNTFNICEGVRLTCEQNVGICEDSIATCQAGCPYDFNCQPNPLPPPATICEQNPSCLNDCVNSALGGCSGVGCQPCALPSGACAGPNFQGCQHKIAGIDPCGHVYSCDELAGGGLGKGCGCNFQECWDDARCNVPYMDQFTNVQATIDEDCDDVVASPCNCSADYATCTGLCNTNLANCMTTVMSGGSVNGLDCSDASDNRVRPGFQPQPACIEFCREEHVKCIADTGNCEDDYTDCMDNDALIPPPASNGQLSCACNMNIPGCVPYVYCTDCSAAGDCPPAGGPLCTFEDLLRSAKAICWHWGNGNSFYEQVWDSWILAQGDCVEVEVAEDGAYRWIFDPVFYDSTFEAINQGIKQMYRGAFLSDVDKGARKMFDISREAADELELFINGPFPTSVFTLDGAVDSPVEKMICERMRLDGVIPAGKCLNPEFVTAPPSALPAHSIYAWQGEKKPGQPRGNWHIVRVDVKIPTRCKGKCYTDRALLEKKGVTDANLEPTLPVVKSYTRRWGTRRCYSLGDSFDKVRNCDERGEYDDDKNCFQGGVVMANVVRFDEDVNFTFKFANGFNIWKAKFFHPDSGEMDPAFKGNLDTLERDCETGTVPPLLVGDGALMLNRRGGDSGGDPVNSRACWDTINREFLSHGVSSKTCAQYFFHDEPPRGMSLKFIPCPARITLDDEN